MDSRYRFSANIPNRYDQISNTNNNNNNNNPNLINSGNRLTPTSSRYFHRVSPIFPPHHQQRIHSPSPVLSSSYLGPLQQHRPRFLSTWDLTPTPTIYHSSRNIATRTPTPTSVPMQQDEDRTQLQSMPAKDFADLVMLPREWRRGDDCIQWPRNHEYYNIEWLENLWN
ncbi:unnamed protein product, partial [Rotaria sordida]